LYLKPTAEMI